MPRSVLSLDINIVIANNDKAGSVFYYSQYKLAAVTATKAPTKWPTKAPTKWPTKKWPTNKWPTKAPIKWPTKAPIKWPTKAPTKWPTKAPTKVQAPIAADPTPVAPVKAPQTPTKAPTKSKRCGVFGWRLFCPQTCCGVVGRLLGWCHNK